VKPATEFQATGMDVNSLILTALEFTKVSSMRSQQTSGHRYSSSGFMPHPLQEPLTAFPGR
jgi:hypothetical protein